MYASVIGTDGSDLTDSDNPNYFKPSFADFGRLAPANEVTVNEGATGIAAAGKFLSELDWSPLWVTLKTTGVAIVFIFVLGLLAAYWCLHLSQKAKNIADTIFTIPMVLPPTVCGFISAVSMRQEYRLWQLLHRYRISPYLQLARNGYCRSSGCIPLDVSKCPGCF